MKKAALLLSGLLLSALASGVATAEVVRVRVTARVTQIDDFSNTLAGKIVLGQRVNGLYIYNTNTPNTAPFPGVGEYRPYANEARLRIAVGSMVFESKQPTQGITINIAADGSGFGHFHFHSTDNKALADGTMVNLMGAYFLGQGNITQSAALPTVAPIPHTYMDRELRVSATVPGGGSYTFAADIESAELVETAAIVVSPASGTFAPNQQFDAAVILPRNSVVATAQATANGMPLPLSYPGVCQFQPQTPVGKPTLRCPAAHQVLTVPGTPIEWTVELTNGTVYTETVNWELQP